MERSTKNKGYSIEGDKTREGTWIDPAEGWKYGFPKFKPKEDTTPIYDWILKQGYPESLLKYPYRCWEGKEGE